MPIKTLPVAFDEGDFGPAMLALTQMQRLFVIGKVHLGLSDVAAAKAAGYASADDHAWRVARHEGVQAAILEEGRKLLRSEGPQSIKALIHIRDNPQAGSANQLKAAIELLNRAGFHAVTENHTLVEHRLSEGELDRRILALCAEMGMSPDEAKKMLIAPADMKRNAEGVYEIEQPPLSSAPEAVARRATRRRRKGMTPEEVEADKARIREEKAERGRREYAAHQDLEEYLGDEELADIPGLEGLM